MVPGGPGASPRSPSAEDGSASQVTRGRLGEVGAGDELLLFGFEGDLLADRLYDTDLTANRAQVDPELPTILAVDEQRGQSGLNGSGFRSVW